MLLFIKRHWLTFVGIFVGAMAGYFYWRLKGCSSGTCMITSNPLNSTLYGALIGSLIFGMFKTKK